MRALAIDTATEILAMCARSGDAWASFSVRRGFQHSPALLPLVDKLLSELGMAVSDLTLIVCSLGPGSFTGIRIGLATVMGMGQGTGVPIVGVSTLDAIALPWAVWDGDVFPVIDARKGKAYTAVFRGTERRTDYLDLSPGELRARMAKARRPLLAGPDALIVRGLMGDSAAAIPCSLLYDPASLLHIGIEKYKKEGGESSGLQPLYLRKSEAETAKRT